MLTRPSTLIFLAVFLAAATSCSDNVTDPIPPDYQTTIDQFGLTPLPDLEYPQYNQYNEERIKLGQLLFFDPILSGEAASWVKADAGESPTFRANDVACASCHHPDFAFGDGRRQGMGVGGSGDDGTALGPDREAPGTSIVSGLSLGINPRNSQTVLNVAFNGRGSSDPTAESFQFMDGRVTLGLEVQAQEPIIDRSEMAGDAYGRPELGDLLTADDVRDSVTARIRDIPDYVDLLKLAYPGEITSGTDITLPHITKAIAAYERELITPGSRYDRFVDGDFGALTADERLGFEVFFGKGLCGDCHHGPMLSDFSFHVQGVSDDYEPGFPGKDGEGRDLGRFHANPNDFVDQKFAFRTLTIRNVELTGPYFHSGSAATLMDVVSFYNRGGQGSEDIPDEDLAAEGAVRHPSIQPLGLSAAEVEALVAFMKTTTAPVQSGPSGVSLTATPLELPSGLVPPGVATGD